jgi:hypothetical protein
MFNWNRTSKQIVDTEANQSLPNGNEIGTPSPSIQITTKHLHRSAKFIEAICEVKLTPWVNKELY